MADLKPISFRPKTEAELALIKTIAEFQGYENLADFLRDAVIDTCRDVVEEEGVGHIADHNRRVREERARLAADLARRQEQELEAALVATAPGGTTRVRRGARQARTDDSPPDRRITNRN